MFDFNIDDEFGGPQGNLNQQQLMKALMQLLQKRNGGSYEDEYDEDFDDEYDEEPHDYFRRILENEGEDSQGHFGERNSQHMGEGEMTGNTLMDIIRKRESGGNYGAVNNLGYSGAYQFGSPLLEDLGYVRKGASRHGNRALNEPSNWTIPGGKEAFLSNPKLQDEAMRKALALNEKRLRKAGVIHERSSPEEINGLLAAAHLGGVGGAKKAARGQSSRDAYGTDVGDYYRMGMKARN